MKKLFSLVLAVLLVCLSMIPVSAYYFDAAHEGHVHSENNECIPYVVFEEELYIYGLRTAELTRAAVCPNCSALTDVSGYAYTRSASRHCYQVQFGCYTCFYIWYGPQIPHYWMNNADGSQYCYYCGVGRGGGFK